MSHHTRQLCLLIALLLGLICWWAWFGEHHSVFLTLGPAGEPALLLFAATALIAALLPTIQNAIARISAMVRRPKPSTQTITTIAIAAVSTAYLIVTAVGQHRPLYPIVHDEFSYLISAHQLVGGKLWMPAHPLGKFFDSFQLIVDPVYASAYFPGTAMFFAIAIITHVPPWLAASFASGAVVGLLYWIVTELIDGAAGIQAALLLVSIEMFRTLSVMVMAQIPLMLAGEIALVGWLKWNKTGRARWALLIGAACGWAAIIRPVDALCFAIPIGVGITWVIPRRRAAIAANHGLEAHATKINSLMYIALGVLPFLILQLISNHGITGHWFETPFRYYADRDHPLTSFGFHDFDPSAHPISDLPQKQALYFNEYVPQIIEHTPANVPGQWWRARLRKTLTFGSAFPFPLLLPLLPVGLMAARGRAWAVLSALPLFVALYSFYVFFLPHYPIVIAPAVILGILLGAKTIPDLVPRGQKIIGAWLSLMIVGLAIASLPQWDHTANDEMFEAPLIAAVNHALISIGDRPSVVLFRYNPGRNINEEPVYNADAAWPDDARIIRAHDRGDDNRAIFRYCADHQPDRSFYLFDERDYSMRHLGTAKSLADVSH